MPRLETFQRPYSEDDEAHVFWETFHHCPQALERLNNEGSEDARWCDALLFPIGAVGFGMPRGDPFAVYSTEPCGGCGKIIGIWAAWENAKIIDMGAFNKNRLSE